MARYEINQLQFLERRGFGVTKFPRLLKSIDVERDNSRSAGEELVAGMDFKARICGTSRSIPRLHTGDQCIGTRCPAGRNYRQLAIGNASRNYRHARSLIGVGIKPDGFTFDPSALL